MDCETCPDDEHPPFERPPALEVEPGSVSVFVVPVGFMVPPHLPWPSVGLGQDQPTSFGILILRQVPFKVKWRVGPTPGFMSVGVPLCTVLSFFTTETKLSPA